METLPESQPQANNARPNKRRYLAASERQRAVRACDECRRLKEKCEGGTPCKRCKHLRRSCDFNVSPTLDKRVPVLADSLKVMTDRMQLMERLLKHHLPAIDLETESLRQACDALSVPSPDLTDARSSPGVDRSELVSSIPANDLGIEEEGCTIDNLNGAITHYSGEFSHWNFSMHVKRNVDNLMAQSNLPNFEFTKPIPEFWRVGEAQPDSASMLEITSLLPPRPIAEFLKNVFFKHATSSYFYLDERWLEEAIGVLYSGTANLGAKDVTAACLVVMVLAVGTQYAHLESSQRQRRYSATNLVNPGSDISSELDIGSAFYRQVAKLLSEIIHSGSLLSVQVCLLLGLYSLPIDASGLGYIYLNLAIKLAIQNGMHRKTSRNSFDPNTEEIRRRVWWSAYCMERRIGAYHGRPASISRSEIDVDVPAPQMSYNNDSVRNVFDPSNLIASIALTGQIEASLLEILALRRSRRSEAGAVINRIKSLKANAKGWRPSQVGSTPLPSSTSRAEIHTRLDCCLLEMFIGRPFILVHRQGQSESGTDQELLVQDCVSAAEEAIEMCHSMQTGELGLTRSSYIEYSSCRAALLVLIAYSIGYRTNRFSATLQRGLDAIREMALTGDSARSEISLLETLEAALHHLHIFDLNSSRTGSMARTDVIRDDYEEFVQWYRHRMSPGHANAGTRHNVDGALLPQAAHANVLGSDQQGNAAANYEASSENQWTGLDFQDMGNDTAFFNTEFSQNDLFEKDLLDSLLWIPD